MKSGTQNQMEGAFHQMAGDAKKITGDLTDNPKLRAKGVAEHKAGKAQEKAGKAKNDSDDDSDE